MHYKYEHFGVPVSYKRDDMLYYPEYKVWATNYDNDPYRIEWIYFEKDTPMHTLIQTIPHVCFMVSDIQQAVRGKTIIFAPVHYQGHWIAFIEENGVPIEFFQ